jgi:hypothetical protein
MIAPLQDTRVDDARAVPALVCCRHGCDDAEGSWMTARPSNCCDVRVAIDPATWLGPASGRNDDTGTNAAFLRSVSEAAMTVAAASPAPSSSLLVASMLPTASALSSSALSSSALSSSALSSSALSSSALSSSALASSLTLAEAAEACVTQLAASVAQAMRVRRLPHRPGRLHRV